MTKIYLYAELLTHIRTLTLHASLQTAKQEGTKVDVSTDKKVISVTHDGETEHLYLPTQIKGDASITFPLQRSTDISARVQIEDEHEWKCSVSNEVEAPWMAPDLDGSTELLCRNCNACVLESGKVNTWKNLPSVHWAELMDMWFCHKPHVHGHDEDAAAAKGFSAESRLAVAPGTGMTDLISVVLHENDCTNVKAAEAHEKPTMTVLRCASCAEMLGTTNEDENLIRLHKSSLAVRSRGSTRVVTYPSSTFTCAQILSLIESTALKRFVAYTRGSEQPIELWIFNPDIFYSCSAYRDNTLLSMNENGEVELAGTSHVEVSEPDATSSTVAADKPDTKTSSDSKHTTTEGVDSADLNPHGDDMSQIYGDDVPNTSSARNRCPQIVAGEIEVEVPVRNKDDKSQAQSEAQIEDIKDTETPLITSRANDPTAGSAVERGSIPQQTNKEHINMVHRASKIFYKQLPQDTNPIAFLDTNSNTHEDLFFANPKDLEALRDTLETSTAMLPASARSFQDWSIGLLHRYESVPSGLGVMAENPLARGIKSKDGRVTRWDIGHGAEGLYA